MKFINNNVAIAPHRTAANIDIDDLYIELVKRAQAVGFDIEPSNCDNKDEFMRLCVLTLMEKCPEIKLDSGVGAPGPIGELAVSVDSDEFYADANDAEDMIGFNTIDDLTFFGFVQSDSSLCSMQYFTMLYWDGERIRCYVPKRGNLINMDEADIDGVKLPCPLNYGDDVYAKRYGYDDVCLIEFLWDEIKKDFATAIVVEKTEKSTTNNKFTIGQYVYFEELDDSDKWEYVGSFAGDALGNTCTMVYFSKSRSMLAVFEMDSAYTYIEEWDDWYAKWLKNKCKEYF